MKQEADAERQVSLHVLLADLKACSIRRDLEWGRRIHAKALKSGNDRRVHVVVALVKMYAKCGSMVHARHVFNSIMQPNVATWTALLSGYAENGEGQVALDLFARMKSEGSQPNSLTYLAALKACTSLAVKQDASRKAECLLWGKQIHSEIGCCLDPRLHSTLIGMYAKCGSMVEAKQVFDGTEHRDVVSWTALILGYAENGDGLVALDLFFKMKAQCCVPDSITYVAVLKACTSLSLKGNACGRTQCLQRGRQIHSEIGCHLNIYVQNTLIDMYAKCGSMGDAKQVFDVMSRRDALSWNPLVSGYAENGEPVVALNLFSRMKANGCVPDCITYAAALKACASLALKENSRKRDCLEQGKRIHLEIGSHLNLRLQNTLIVMYCSCGSTVDAKKVFDSISNPDVVSWNVLSLGYAENGEGLVALELFSRMKAHGYVPDSITYVAALKACTSLALKGNGCGRANYLEWGRKIHSEVGCHLNLYVQNTLIDMYAKCGNMVYAKQVFDNIRHRDVVSWTALLLGYAENGEGLFAIDLFSRMKADGCTPDSITYVAVLKACSLLGALEFGRKVHKDIREFNVATVTCLVDFYAKCGSLVEAQEVFDFHSETRDVSTWSALLAGYSRFGEIDSVFKLFERMQDADVKPNAVTLLSLLTCCSHAGLVVKAKECFESMSARYLVSPSVEHYTCMIDVLGRANKLDDALVLLQRMPCSPDVVTWTAILCACCKWKNVEVGKLAFQSWVNLDENTAAAYVLMGHIYSSRGMWEEQEVVLGMRKKSQAWKLPEQTCWTNGVGEVHKFLGEESGHPEIAEIREEMRLVNELMKECAYVA